MVQAAGPEVAAELWSGRRPASSSSGNTFELSPVPRTKDVVRDGHGL